MPRFIYIANKFKKMSFTNMRYTFFMSPQWQNFLLIFYTFSLSGPIKESGIVADPVVQVIFIQ